MPGAIRIDHDEAKRLGLKAMTEDEAWDQASMILRKFEPSYQAKWLNYGSVLPVAMATAPGVYFAGAVRTAVRLQSHTRGRIAVALPAAVIPATFVGITYTLHLRDILLQKTKCHVCLETRTAALAAFGGGVLPVALGTFGGYYTMQLAAARIPQVFTREHLSWLGKFFSKHSFAIGAAVLGQAAMASFLTYVMVDEWRDINLEILRRVEQDSGKK